MTPAHLQACGIQRRAAGLLCDLPPHRNLKTMIIRFKLAPALCALALLAVGAATTLAVPLSRQEGDRLQAKVDAIAKNGAADKPKPAQTAVTEPEANSYLAFNLKEKIPKGLSNPEIAMIGDGALAARALVDIDEVNRHRNSRSVIDPLNYLSGRVPIQARGVLRTGQGRGQFYLQSADISGIPLPKALLQELVSFFSRSEKNPAGFDIDAPFDLPAKVREVTIKSGESLVIQ